MDADEYLTIKTPGHAQTRVMASKFLGYVFHLKSPADFESELAVIQKKYYDATHWCWAWRIGRNDSLLEKSSDAGEPHGTAGLPILRTLQSSELTNCAVVVTRYYGGTKLGTGNLARAYGECAALALESAAVVLRTEFVVLETECSYDDSGIVYHLATRHEAFVQPQQHPQQAAFTIKLRRRDVEAFTKQLTDESAGRIRTKETGTWIS